MDVDERRTTRQQIQAKDFGGRRRKRQAGCDQGKIEKSGPLTRIIAETQWRELIPFWKS
jgi:hypothetical protein